jgi:Transposase domain (DUF772).
VFIEVIIIKEIIMFKTNSNHIQQDIFGYDLSKMNEVYARIKETAEYSFYETIFCNIDEEIFAQLFCQDNGRPNAPINAMVSALILKEKKNWTYRQLFESIEFNLLTRSALGIFHVGDMPFNEPTLFNFQNRVKDYEEEHNVNLFEKVFDDLTADQLKKLKLNTNIARTDSFMIDSNIKSYGRLQLLIEVILRVYRMLNKSDKKLFSDHFQNYTDQSSEHYMYQLKGSDLPHEYAKVTELYYWIKSNLPSRYFGREEYRIFNRVYEEHFKFDEDEKLRLRDKDEIGINTLQSPDDPDATYRKKHGRSHKGQVASITETAHPDNELNLIVDISVQPNNKDDSKILEDRLDELKEKLPDIDELHFDGGYGSEDNDKKMEGMGIVPIQTAVRGRKAKISNSWKIEKDEEDNYYVTCPNQQTVKAEPTKTRFKACYGNSICSACIYRDKCPTIALKHCYCYYFTEEDFLVKQRHKNIYDLPLDKRKIRPNVEASVCEFTRKMNNHKLKVRGAFKAALFVFSAAIAINFGRIYRYSKNISGNSGDNNSFISAISKISKILRIITNKILYITLQNPKSRYLCFVER